MSKSKPVDFSHRDMYIRLGLNIAYYRKMLSMTQEALAEKAQTSRTTISMAEAPNVVKPISLELLFCIADALHVEPWRLLKFPDGGT